jgi:hypothetical protein
MKLLGFLLCALGAAAQTVPLAGTWKETTGDDLRWAAPEFDDSNWTNVRMPRPSHPGARGYTWHRLRIETPALTEPHILIGPLYPAYEIFANGRKIGEFGGPLGGRFGQRFARPAIFALPPGERSYVVAIRSWDVNIPLGYQASDAARSQSWIGTRDSLEDKRAAWALDRLERTLPMRLISWTLLLGAGFFLAMPVWRRNSPENLWFGVFLLMVVFVRTFQFVPEAIGFDDRTIVYFCYNLSAIPVTLLFWPRFMETLFQARRSWISWTGITLVTVLLCLANAGVILGTWQPLQARVVLAAWFLLNLNQGLVYLDVSRHAAGRDRAMLPVHAALWLYLGTSLIFYSAPFFSGAPVLGMGSDTPPVGDVILRAPVLLFMFAMGILLNQQAARVEAEQGRLRQEMAAAAEIQTLLLPPGGAVPGVDRVYLPASEVGGDFYQVLERSGGSRLIAVGDVSGKGLKAAMLVSVVAGALRQSTASSPGEALGELNRVLMGQTGGGFVTCCCVRIAADGELTIANAGHLAPYLDGREVAVDTGLPLGLVAGADYPETRLPFPPHAQLTLLSDGVVEAANAQGELFGFDRTAAMSGQPAADIAEAARAWGQNDDITVVTVRRTA